MPIKRAEFCAHKGSINPNGKVVMSDDNDNFDFDFDSFNADDSQVTAGENSFDLDNPFGDDIVVSSGASEEPLANPEGSSFDLSDPIGNDLVTPDLGAAQGGVSADNPYLNDSATSKKKKGWFSKSKDKPAKEEKPKKEKTVKEKKPAGERIPLDLPAILCIAFSVFLMVSLLMFNIAAILSRGPESTIMQTLCFLGAFNIIGLAAAAVPILFYKLPQERTLPNVLLGISAVASFSGLLMLLNEFYCYGFLLRP